MLSPRGIEWGPCIDDISLVLPGRFHWGHRLHLSLTYLYLLKLILLLILKMSVQDINFVKHNRKYMRAEVTRLFNSVTSSLSSYTKEDKLQVIARLQSLQKDLKAYDLKVAAHLFEEGTDKSLIEKEYDDSAEYDNKIISAITRLNSSISDSSVGTSDGTGTCNIHHKQLKLPELPLPEYGHREGEDLNKFFTNFEHVINRYSLSGYEKFVFLQKQLSNEPLTLVKSLEVGKQDYLSAKLLLQQAFASTLTQHYETISRLSRLKLEYNDDPYKYIGDMRMLTESFRSLKIDADTVLQYFFWHGMNDTLQAQFVNITNKNKPSLKEINEHMLEATERYIEVSKKMKMKKEKNPRIKDAKPGDLKSDVVDKSASSFAANINVNKGNKPKNAPYCTLCSGRGDRDESHSTFNCKAYPTPVSKRDRLNELKGCLKCGNLSHEAANCRFRFHKKCLNCAKYHFTYLCISDKPKVKSDSSQSSTKKNASSSVSDKNNDAFGGISVGGVSLGMLAQYGEDAVIPTFSISVRNYKLRCMRDSGCQPNFITDEMARKLNLKVVQSNFSLTVNGFNASEQYLTNIVEMCIDKDSSKIKVICIPSIRTKLVLPGLSKVARVFTDKGYKLADDFLLEGSDEIGEIDFILGNSDSQVMPQREVQFGSPVASVYSVSPFGILLIGSINRYLNNLNYLPELSDGDSLGPILSDSDNSLNNFDCLTNQSDGDSLGPMLSDSDIPLAKEENLVDSLLSNNCCSPDSDEFYVNDELCTSNINIFSQYVVVDEKGEISETALEKAAEAILNEQFQNVLNYDKVTYEENTVDSNKSLTDFVLNNTNRREDGRLIMPLLWNSKVCRLLGTNYNLAKQILKGTLKNLQKKEGRLKMYDEVIKDQERQGIIEQIDDLPKFLEEHPAHSFLPHMGVFKMDRETTKCRVVYLSNLSEGPRCKSISHNQAMLSGPNLNRKMSTALLELRFDKYLLCFDLKKAFLQIALNPVDQARLLFLWYRNVEKKDFRIVGYKCLRLAFGLRCSPAILMLALFKLLILDSEDDDVDMKELKKLIYCLMYMDNGAVTANSSEYLNWAYDQLDSVFQPYQFAVQQVVTNDCDIQSKLDSEGQETSELVKVFGHTWNRATDSISTRPLHLDTSANTKRLILSTIANNYDLFQINGPILNRARLFVHRLQCDGGISWDDRLTADQCREWRNIAKQVNGSPSISIDRFVGRRDSKYRLIAFTDSSKSMYGVVIYIQDLSTNKISFLMAKNRIINKQLEGKSIPCLEFHAISFGAETLNELHRELSGDLCVLPISVTELHLCSDSMVALNWIYSSEHKLDKMQRLSPFILNRLNCISKHCDSFPISFHYIPGIQNPADCVTRPISYKQLMQTDYFLGPEFLRMKGLEYQDSDCLNFRVPFAPYDSHEYEEEEGAKCMNTISVEMASINEPLIPVEKYSSFHKLVGVHRFIIKFINKLKIALKRKDPCKYSHIQTYNESDNLYEIACQKVICDDQKCHYGDIFKFFDQSRKCLKGTPNLVMQLNLFRDTDGLLKVKSKFERWKDNAKYCFPILLSKHSKLTYLIITDLHQRHAHAGVYSILAQLRKQFYVPQHFSAVKKILKECVVCRRFNRRPIQLNQSSYRQFRLDPPNRPFAYIFIDHMGYFWIKHNNKKVKAWILCITCLWSRAINLKVCLDLTVKELLRSLQLHIFEFGTPELVLSDMGSQLVAGANLISDLIKDTETQLFFEERNMKSIKFDHYFKGCNELGSLVEICVKLTKRLIHGSIRNNVLDLIDFQFIVAQTVHLVNKRPIAFKESLRGRNDEAPSPITPEILLKGYDLASIDIVPSSEPGSDSDWRHGSSPIDHIRESFAKLNKVRNYLSEIYQSEFLAKLTSDAVSSKERYKPVRHQELKKGDIVLLNDGYLKAAHYPLGIVKEVFKNQLNEVTGVLVMKGGTREAVKRHVSSIIPLLDNNEDDLLPSGESKSETEHHSDERRSKRESAVSSSRKTAKLFEQNLA